MSGGVRDERSGRWVNDGGERVGVHPTPAEVAARRRGGERVTSRRAGKRKKEEMDQAQPRPAQACHTKHRKWGNGRSSHRTREAAWARTRRRARRQLLGHGVRSRRRLVGSLSKPIQAGASAFARPSAGGSSTTHRHSLPPRRRGFLASGGPARDLGARGDHETRRREGNAAGRGRGRAGPQGGRRRGCFEGAQRSGEDARHHLV